MDDNEEILKEFLTESYENLDQLDRDFVALEANPGARDRIDAVFRTIHTIKGTSGFLNLGRLEALTHAGEGVLSKCRDGKLALTPDVTSALLATVDAVRRMLANIQRQGDEGDVAIEALVARLAAVQQPGVAAAAQAASPVAATPEGDPGAAPTDASVRVDVGLLDKLMNLVGELVLARNQILQYGATARDPAFLSTTQRLNLITTELQEGVMKTRMQPIGNIWGKFPRVVRDLALACGKQVRIETEGRDTELDRTIIEAIKDPLTHMVRNAVDHGIEAPEERARRGKDPVGRLFLRAFHEGGQVNLEITDDGAGIDPARIRQKAVERGVVTAERAARMTDRETLALICLPGFSTAEAVTSVSGRGVGMDVVKTNIEKIGGTLDVQSRPGAGTTVKIKIPLTLAIIPALVVTSRGERFAIPQVSLLELVRLEGASARSKVESIHGAPVYRLRGHLLPIVYLARVLGFDDAPPTASEAPGDDAINVVVLQADGRQFGLVVDGVSDTEEIVVKPLGKELKGLSAFAGATIMGDGRVALILDVLGIAQRCNVVAEVRDRSLARAAQASSGAADERQTLLLVRVDDQGRMAIPLSMVARLEEFPRAAVERASGQDVVQYRGEIMPLVDLAAFLGATPPDRAATEALQVVVYHEHGRSVGLVVDRIVDIVEEHVALRHRGARRGVLGAAVVQGRVTDLLDVHGVIRAIDPGFFDESERAA